jgi:hypothetical protein
MSARRRGRRHGALNEATVTTAATVTGAVEVDADGVAEVVSASEVVSAPDELVLRADGRDRVELAGRPGLSGGNLPRRELRARVQAPTMPLPPAAAAPDEPAPIVDDGSEVRKAACTLAQMRRFIKSRPYVPVHELRRRFLIEGDEDDVNAVATGQGTVYVGLPASEARFLSDLIKAGEVGCELLLDPTSPAVVGVYAMRPVARQ